MDDCQYVQMIRGLYGNQDNAWTIYCPPEKKAVNEQSGNMLSISVSYLSQLEHGVRVNPNIELLLHLSEALHLSSEETEVLFDLYASVNDALSPDVVLYAKSNPIVVRALRTARDCNLTDDDWLLIIKWMKMR